VVGDTAKGERAVSQVSAGGGGGRAEDVQANAPGERPDHDLVGELRDRVAYLERQVGEERESRRRADTIIAQLTQANTTFSERQRPPTAEVSAQGGSDTWWEKIAKSTLPAVAGPLATAVVSGFITLLATIEGATVVALFGFAAVVLSVLGLVVGLVGTFFGVKASADARAGAEILATSAGGVGTTTPTITIDSRTATKAVNGDHTVTATVTSVDGSPAANVEVTFRVTDGPDSNTTSTAMSDEFGRAIFTFTNNGTAGTDTIEAAALGGTGTARVEFTP
jgi:hypothetical protein